MEGEPYSLIDVDVPTQSPAGATYDTQAEAELLAAATPAHLVPLTAGDVAHGTDDDDDDDYQGGVTYIGAEAQPIPEETEDVEVEEEGEGIREEEEVIDDDNEAEEENEEEAGGVGVPEEGDEQRSVAQREPEAKVNAPFAISRVKALVKHTAGARIVSREAVAMISQAAALFVNDLVTESCKVMRAKGNKKTLQYDHIAEVVSKTDRFSFLDDVIPIAVPGSTSRLSFSKRNQ